MKETGMVAVRDRPWPRVMRVRPRGRGRSVDRGKRRPSIALGSHESGAPTLLTDGEGKTIRSVIASCGPGPFNGVIRPVEAA